MKTIITAIILMISATAHGQVGLPDAIEALQVVSGVRTAPQPSTYPAESGVALIGDAWQDLIITEMGDANVLTDIWINIDNTGVGEFVTLYLRIGGVVFASMRFDEWHTVQSGLKFVVRDGAVVEGRIYTAPGLPDDFVIMLTVEKR